GCVFDGPASSPCCEWDDRNPRSVYGQSKLGGERELDPGSTVVRTSWVCGLNGRNFVKTILRLAGERDELTVVDDQHGCPTFTPDLAEMIRRLVVARLPGTFHVTNQAATSWSRFAPGEEPPLVQPRPRSFGDSWRELRGSKDLLRQMVRRDLATKHAGSMLGFLWSLLSPAMLVAVYAAVFWVMGFRPIAASEYAH